MADKKKLLFILFSWSLLWAMMAGRIPDAHSARLKLQNAHATFYGSPDASVTIPTTPPTPAPIINDDKKEDTKAENDSKLLVKGSTTVHAGGAAKKDHMDIDDVEEAANGGGGAGHIGGDGHN